MKPAIFHHRATFSFLNCDPRLAIHTQARERKHGRPTSLHPMITHTPSSRMQSNPNSQISLLFFCQASFQFCPSSVSRQVHRTGIYWGTFGITQVLKRLYAFSFSELFRLRCRSSPSSKDGNVQLKMPLREMRCT